MYPETGYTSPNELGIIIENNRPVVSSRKVAEVFEKEHNIVMRSIRELGCDDDFSRCNFAQSTYMSDRGKEYPEYLMTRLGFSVLIMTNELGIVIENNRPVVSSRKVAEVF
ncbi:Rha family transcriptional regulator, partial [Cloacibacillus evryensis]|nr:Rha family transcriptional regulator [Cloacibacillus evryensis]